MNNKVVMFLDDEGNSVPEDQATRINIAEYDDNGRLINETFMVKNQELSEEEAKKYWDEVEVDTNSELIKNAVFPKREPNPIQDFLDQQKSR